MWDFVREGRHLEREEDEILALELSKDGEEVSPEETGDMRLHESLKTGAGPEPLQLVHDEQPLLSHLLLSPPYRQTRARRRCRSRLPGRTTP